jgi:DNA-directed RNA polymerase II subunit RPB2
MMDESIPLKIKQFDYKLDKDALYAVGDAFIEENTLIGHHLNSANAFYSTGIKHIITKGFDIRKVITNIKTQSEENKKIDRIECAVKFTDVKISPPTTYDEVKNREVPLMPRTALALDKIYSGPLHVSCEIEAIAYLKSGEKIKRNDFVKDYRIAKIPIIKGSIACNTYSLTKEALMQLGEDPNDPGGYFITKHEYAIDSTESTTFNQLKIYINEGYGKSRIRADYISKPGDGWENSDMCIIVFNTDDTLTVEISRNRLMGVQIPFYLLFRALGWTNDKDILDWIVYDYDAPANKSILNYAIAAMNAKYKMPEYRNIYDQTKALKEIVDLVPEPNYNYLDLKNHPENYHNAILDVLATFDQYFLPHIGLTKEYRLDKLKFLGIMIRKVLMVYLGHIPQTDRDSYRIKRIHAAGDNAAKTFKQIFNQTAAMPIKKQMTKMFNTTSFSQVNLANMVKNAIYVDDFERLIVQTIIAGNKSSLKIKKRVVTNRLMAQQLHRKNQLNMWATMRQVSSTSADSAKQSERAAEMRRVHMSAIGYICCVHSPPEGEKVGINKQIAIFASIAPASSSDILKKLILEDVSIIREELLKPIEIYRNNYSPVYVNGHLIAYTKDSIALVNKYRNKRRRLEINPYTTIYWDNTQNEVQFFVDIGRMVRPLTIVYNNKRDADVFGKSDSKSGGQLDVKLGGQLDSKSSGKSKKGSADSKSSDFEQYVAITRQDIIDLITKKKGIYDLVKEQKVEFITPEEQQNYYIAPNLDTLHQNRNNDLKEYTHCDIAQAILGITALTSPFGNHNQAARVTYQTSQSKQTCGYYVGNWPFRIDKETFLQYVNDNPLIKTAVNRYVFPNGNNCMVAMMCYTGMNQEDSLIINRAAIERGLFNGCKFDFEKDEIEQKEQLGTADITKTEGIKSANYSKLVDGIVRPGTIIKQNDVLISKYMSIPKSHTSKNIYLDRSRVYGENEPAIVQNVIEDKNEEGIRFVKVGIRKIRPLAVGDKLSSRAGQKGIAALLMDEADMPFTESGIRPDILFNAHGIPSRMTLGQLIESLIGNVCAIKGTHYDGTIFKEVNIEEFAEQLEQYGFNKYGYERMLNGMTGEFIDTMIFFGPTFYQRLQKFVLDAEYSVRRALTDAMTKQPLDGQSSNGGLRIGEMERDVICSHGASQFLREKFFNHSDGYTEYICRCGKPAIVNKREGIFKCKSCKDMADITAVPTSWTSKLFMQEMVACNVGIRRIPKPFNFPMNDNEYGDYSKIESYSDDTLDKLLSISEDAINDIVGEAE